ncbi:neurochondrin homolog [Episyrphus balteatus]|uniref:neurochondrin homolog n=1 Tax=Episyrphus balteatus TaxID=286459 RepID=UPI0024868A3B|nr:neurochondrin homolog [Episyrphus balteatus]XP_055847255.1 neurochondrin homolog [Episyrphus balteatus]XP_055847256.1 neurochondrin homolog [Episyrphus balteatus]XP_055847257.1 neurochondrin homolog [Episyrphus balteatus]
MAEIPESVKKCAAMLKGSKTDTEKFAALFMVTKLVKGKDCNPPAKKLLFEAIGFGFLKKLLNSKDLPNDCPPLVYKSVALSILTCFCQEEELATHKDMIDAIPTLLEIVETADDDDYDDNLIVVSEAYSCLKSIATYESGQNALLSIGAIPKMSQIYSQQSFQTDEALHLIVMLTSKFGPASWTDDPKPFHALIQRIALDMETDHSDRKFELCKILSSILTTCRREIIVNTLVGEIWPESVFKGCSDILKSKIGPKQRDPTLHLIATTLQVLGIQWAFMDDSKQFFLLLLQLAAIEVRMQMDEKKLETTFKNAELITACFIILELCIEHMAGDEIDLEPKEKQTTYTALKGAFNQVLAVLTRVSNDKIKDNMNPRDRAFICAIVRILSAWLAQETTAMRPAIYKILPFMFKLSNETFYDLRAHRKENKEGEPPVDILRVMLPALCHLAVEDDARKIMFTTKQDAVFLEAIEFYYSISNYKKPPIPRAERLKRMNEPDPVPTPKQVEEMKDARTAVVSLCNILMNLTVLEPKIVEESPVFANLLKFVYDNLPELKDTPDNLVMHGHLAVLGLLLLKQQSSKVKQNDFSICRYIQATIRFLWDAYNIDESNDPTALVVSIAYKEHWMEISELWFLGMQTMCGVLPLIPWISEFAVESGWAEGIVQTLKKVKIGTLPPNVKSAYEDFLSQLVDANPSVVAVLKKADALRVCRNHRMMDLGKKLFGD